MIIIVATLIKAYLEENGIKQNWLVDKLRENGVRISPSKLSAILNGTRPLWADMLAEIVKVLKVDANVFMKSKASCRPSQSEVQ